jgi:DNA mismatch repair protein MutS2
LARVAAGEQRPTLVDTAAGERTLSLLEWPLVTEQIASFCLTAAAAARIRDRRPCTELEPLQLWWSLTDELRPDGEAGNWPPLVEVAAGWELLQRPAPGGFRAEELVVVAALAEALDEMRDHLSQARHRLPVWGEAAVELATFHSLTAEIRRKVDRDGHVQDAASTTLARLRRACLAQEKLVRQEVTAVMQRARSQGWTTESEVTLRGDRFCLPLRSGASRRIDGIVHARSASGGTLFVEPASVVHLHNELSELRLEAADEERRILLELNRWVEEAAPALDEACRFLILLDEVRAGILWSKHYRCSRPRLQARGKLRLCACRHPLLVQYGPGGTGTRAKNVSDRDGRANTQDQVVPLELELPADKQVVVLSGPNAGGKSVALKTVGVCVLLGQSGWDIPAREDTALPLVKKLFVDLGDEQSIAKSLSSFSAHLSNLVRFLDQADPDSLVLCDEIGAGTDPQEGTALAFAVLSDLARQGAVVLASTHFGLLKAAVHDHPQMVNAAMDFDEVSLRPLYTLRLGVPGTSHAFAIAGRLGMPENLLAEARDLVGEERFQIERLLGELGRRARDLASAEAELRRQLAAHQQQEAVLAEKLANFESQRQQLLAQTRSQGEDLLRQGRQAIERAVREIRSSDGEDLVIRTARDRLTALGEKLPPAEPPPRPAALAPGDRIHIPHLGLSGQVVEVRGDKIVADANGMRLTLNRQALAESEVKPSGTGTGGTPEADSGTGNGTPVGTPAPEAGWRWHDLPPEIQHEIDLRGQRAEEAWRQLDHLIDRAIPAGLREILVIHGVGSGRLRAYLHDRLSGDPRLASFQVAEARRGGYGATVVKLAET